MFSRHQISTDARAAALILLGTTLFVAPGVLGLETAAIIAALVVGTFAFGLGVAGTAFSGRGTLPVSAHAVYDSGIALGLILGGAMFALSDFRAEAAFFAVAGGLLLLIGMLTRYTATRPTAL